MIVFDIETAALPDDQISELLPEFDDSKYKDPGTFDVTKVKFGNTKDEAKKQEKIEKSRADHQAAIEKYQTDYANALAEHLAKSIERAALSATTGRIVAIGVYDPSKNRTAILHNDADEAEMLRQWWSLYEHGRTMAKEIFAGFNIEGFDIPFLIQRSRILDVDVPSGIYDRTRRYLADHFIDLMKVWTCGVYGQSIKLDLLAKTLGVGGKQVDADGKKITGKDFARLWFGSVEDRQKAVEYLTNDLMMTAGVARKLGVN
jgi:uncharacterized protein YprB with RNaseH-like and TPR domain